MRLYGTVESDRASKGQGGNKSLRIVVTADTHKGREHVGEVNMHVDGDHIITRSSIPANDTRCIKAVCECHNEKGEKQKVT